MIRALLFSFLSFVGPFGATVLEAGDIAPLDRIHHPVYHPNGALAWNGDPNGAFYHDNFQVVWYGYTSRDQRAFYFNNGKMVWPGYLNRESSSYSPCTVTHRNGTKAWMGATSKETSSFSACSVYHSNGTKAWMGMLAKEASSYTGSTVYHNNGTKAWMGGLCKECTTYEACTIYHINGAVAWRGEFAKDTPRHFYSALYYDNGQLAWTTKEGDPAYDRNGYQIAESLNAMNLPLGDNSWLQIGAEGTMSLHLCLGESCYLTFSNQEVQPSLSMFLGPGYTLQFFPTTGQVPHLLLYGTRFIINY